MQFYLETNRLILREIRETDIDGMFELDSNDKVHQYLGKHPIKNKKEALENILFIGRQYKELGIGRFAVIEKSSGDFVGWSGLKFNIGEKEALNDFQNFVDIGFRLIPKYRGKGYATESSVATLQYGFNTMNYPIIFGAADVENIGSNTVLQKIGLRFINTFYFKQTECNWYELKKEDYGK